MRTEATQPPADEPASREELIAAAPVHRRAFLGWCGLGGTATALATTLPATAAKGVAQRILNRSPLMLNEVTQAEFAACVGEVFRLETSPGQFAAATLSEASLLKNSMPGEAAGRRAPFSLLFRVPVGTVLPQRIYALEQARLGRLEIFLVPVGRAAGDLLLEAVFN